MTDYLQINNHSYNQQSMLKHKKPHELTYIEQIEIEQENQNRSGDPKKDFFEKDIHNGMVESSCVIGKNLIEHLKNQ